MEIKNCPFCGHTVAVEQIPLWRESASGTYGYVGQYKFKIKCTNCGAKRKFNSNSTLHADKETAKTNVINSWNERVESGTDQTIKALKDFIYAEIDNKLACASLTSFEAGYCAALIKVQKKFLELTQIKEID